MLLLSSCSSGKNATQYQRYSFEEFVEDSKIIDQGKLAILKLEGETVAPFNPEMMEEYQDTIEENDVLRVRLYHPQVSDVALALQEMDNMGFRVVDGEVSLPGLSHFRIIGLTIKEARKLLQAEYNKQIEGAELFIDYLDRLKRRVEMVGMVLKPYIPVDGKIRLYEVLSEAQISPKANLFSSYVARGGKSLPIDLNKLLKEGDLSRNIVMKGQDKIYIAEADESYVMVLGEVFHPKAVPTPKGSISLRDALVHAGGVPYTGDRERILIIRGNIETPKLYLLGWDQILKAPNKNLLLMAGDTVFVAEKSITKWNRFIDQLFPSFSGILTLGQIKKISNDN
jgi:polysaccharide biosynthesis/export protein